MRISLEYPQAVRDNSRSEEHTSELQSRRDLVCRLLLEKKQKIEFCRLFKFLDGAYCPVHEPALYRLLGAHSLRLQRPAGYLRDVIGEQLFFFFNDPAPPEIYPLSLPGPLPC